MRLRKIGNMNKKGQLSVGEIVIVFMGIIIAIAFLPQIFDTQTDLTTKRVATNEVVDISSAIVAGGAIDNTVPLTIANTPDGWKATGCPIESFVIGNATADFTVTTDYTFSAANGTLILENTAAVNGSFASDNDSLVDYVWCADGYNTDGGARSVAGLIGLFSVFILLAFVIFYFRKNDIFQ